MPLKPASFKSMLSTAWRQLPLMLWLIALWMLLWGQFTWLSFVSGVVVAIFVSTVMRLPAVELSGRINVFWGAWFLVRFLAAVVAGSVQTAMQVLNPRNDDPGAAVVAVKLDSDDDLIMTHVAVTSSLIPGSLILEADRDTRTLYLHVIGVRSEADVERQRRSVIRWEDRIIRAVGSRKEFAELKQRKAEGLSEVTL